MVDDWLKITVWSAIALLATEATLFGAQTGPSMI
jgi:hypothetical protein